MAYQQTHQYADSVNRHPVSARFVAGEWQSPGLSYDNYSRMQTVTHLLNSGRRSPAPDWAFHDRKLREVIVVCMELRAYWRNRKPTQGDDAERLRAAQKFIADKHRPALMARIEKLCREYVGLKQAGVTGPVLSTLGCKIEEIDTQLRILDCTPQILAGVVYHYWRCGLNSVETGAQLHIKPPHVRQLLWRLNKAAGQLGYGPLMKEPKVREGTMGQLNLERNLVLAAKLRANGTSMKEVMQLFGFKSKHKLHVALRAAGLYVDMRGAHKQQSLQLGQVLPQAEAR